MSGAAADAPIWPSALRSARCFLPLCIALGPAAAHLIAVFGAATAMPGLTTLPTLALVARFAAHTAAAAFFPLCEP
jgi:hypothetical protein